MLDEAKRDYAALQARGGSFDAKLIADMTSTSGSTAGEPHAWLCTLSYRQTIAAHKLIYRWTNETTSCVPMTDWYDTITGKQIGFQARSVVGGVFIKALANVSLADQPRRRQSPYLWVVVTRFHSTQTGCHPFHSPIVKGVGPSALAMMDRRSSGIQTPSGARPHSRTCVRPPTSSAKTPRAAKPLNPTPPKHRTFPAPAPSCAKPHSSRSDPSQASSTK